MTWSFLIEFIPAFHFFYWSPGTKSLQRRSKYKTSLYWSSYHGKLIPVLQLMIQPNVLWQTIGALHLPTTLELLIQFYTYIYTYIYISWYTSNREVINIKTDTHIWIYTKSGRNTSHILNWHLCGQMEWVVMVALLS